MELLDRLLNFDSALWPEGNVSSNRLGWIPVLSEMLQNLEDLYNFEKQIDFKNIVLLGMGGSSLAPLVFDTCMSANKIKQKRNLIVCDTTHPKTVGEVDFSDSIVIVSSKSGTTLEPNVLFDYAMNKLNDPKKFIAITDPNTALDKLARSQGFLKVFNNREDIGGRYSALSYFGIVPALLLGYDLEKLLTNALSVDKEAAVSFGMDFANAAIDGQDKLTIKVPESFKTLGLWLEQLIAESTGKSGKGVVPIPTTQDESGKDRYNTSVNINSIYDLGSIFYRWELATATAGHVLSIDPFNEPNVAESKANTNKVLEKLPITFPTIDNNQSVTEFIESRLKDGDYISLQAYFPYGNDAELLDLHSKLRDKFSSNAVTYGYGPRFLHSTGQLHKGGANNIIAVQLIDANHYDSLPIPTKPYDFNTLISAQSIGDYQSLLNHERRVIRKSINRLNEAL